MNFSIVVAHDMKLGIGKNGDLAWKLPKDMKYFSELTQKTNGAPPTVIMGRKTYQSIPKKFRPLPNRSNIIISRQTDLQISGVEVAHSLQEALELANTNAPIFVIGGGQIYKEAIKHTSCTKLFITIVHIDAKCDTFFPAYNQFKKVSEPHPIKDNGILLEFTRWERA